MIKNSSPHFVKVIDSFDWNDHKCLVFQNATPFSDYLKKRESTLCEEEIAYLALQLLSGLEFFHKSNIKFINFETKNILMENSKFNPTQTIIQNQLVFHFGDLERIDDRKNSEKEIFSAYMPPEYLISHTFTEKSDLWSLGCVIAELYLGFSIFQVTTRDQLHKKIEEYVGPLPQSFSSLESESQSSSFSRNNSQQFFSIDMSYGVNPSLQELLAGAKPAFASFVGLMLQVDPAARPSISSILSHPFLFPTFYDPYQSFLYKNLDTAKDTAHEQFESEKELLKKEYQAEKDKLLQQHNHQIQEMTARHNAQLESTHKQYKGQVDTISKLERELKEANDQSQKNKKKVDRLKRKYNEEKAEASDQYNAKLVELHSQLEEEQQTIKTLKTKLQTLESLKKNKTAPDNTQFDDFVLSHFKKKQKFQ
eukprot:TRINITY_DN7416_c0_g1_i3.p1 TRINITY_DN7416_c0_g1~~TRINITY_DN7416_c0_g1_i3.p1  ORF type:complete len:423 (-),score=103.46 TRINITY_DN7416_c0_g1_i3:10-1278(-)